MQSLCGAIYSKCTGDTGAAGVATLASGGIYDVLAPDAASHPFLTYQIVSAPRDYTFTQLAEISFTILFTAFDEGLDWTNTRAITEALGALLTDSSGWSISGYRVIKVRLINSLDTQEELEGRDYPVTKSWFSIMLATA
jgi:hypothetical protein